MKTTITHCAKILSSEQKFLWKYHFPFTVMVMQAKRFYA